MGRTKEYNAAWPILGGLDDHDGHNGHNRDIYEEEDGDGDMYLHAQAPSLFKAEVFLLSQVVIVVFPHLNLRQMLLIHFFKDSHGPYHL